MSSPTFTRQWILQNKAADFPVLYGPSSTFKLITTDLPPLSSNQVLLKTLYLSNDPSQRATISKHAKQERLYTPLIALGARVNAYGIAEVIESKSSILTKGDIVACNIGWTEYAVLNAKNCMKLEKMPGVSITHFLGALGPTGLTAYYGTKIIAKVGPKDTVVVSGAAGATGSMVVQIAKKMLGCKRVIGIAGTEQKCRWVESLGADICLNYKSPGFKKELVKETEGFVEVFFDNVGGEILDLMLRRMAVNGRVAACGAVSDYNTSAPYGVKSYLEIISMRLEIKGFIVLDFYAQGKGPAATKELVDALKQRKITVSDQNETVVRTPFEKIPQTWVKLFEGGNTGKLITKLDDRIAASL